MLVNQNILCISTSDWQSHWGSRQQIMWRLSRNNRVLFIGYQMSFLHPFRYPRLWKEYRNWKNGLTKVSENLYIYTPFPNLPFAYYSRLVNKVNQYWLFNTIKKLMGDLSFNNPILWIYPPCSAEMVGKFQEKLSVYHCIDDFAYEKNISIRKRTIRYLENKLLTKCDIVLTSAKNLYRSKKKLSKNTYLLPGAVDESLFEKAMDEIKIPPDLDIIPSPRVGLIGILDERFDSELIKFLAQYDVKWSIVIIGKVCKRRTNTSALRKHSNIYFLGIKNRGELPQYCKGLDVCIIPYKVNRFTENVFPLKFFEYLALGKPIVSTALPDLYAYQDLIKIARNHRQFAEKVQDSLREDNENSRKKRIKLAMENTWQHRIDMIDSIFEKYLS